MRQLPRACLCLLLGAPLAASQFDLQKFTADVPAWGEQLGSDVAIDGDVLALSRPGSDVGGIPDRGSIQVYRWAAGAWTLEQEVVAPAAEPWDQLGSCALEGDVLVAGAPLDDVDGAEDAGSVHVFVRGEGGWSQTQTLVAPGGAAGDHFGWRVALDDDLLVVGAPQADAPFETDRGRVYLFRRTAGVFAWESTLSASGSGALSGYAVAVDDGVVAFGAPGTGVAGTACVVRKTGSTWGIQQAFEGLVVGPAPMSFGASVALHDGLLAVGEPGFETGQGAVATYREVGTSFELEVFLSATDDVNYADFGADVSLSGGWIAIGAPGANGSAIGLGAVYLHKWNPTTEQWGPELKLVGGPADPWADLGSAVAIDGPLVVAGAPTEKLVATAFEGSATVFSFVNPAWSYAGGGLPGSHGVPSLTGGGTLHPATTVSLALRDARESATTALFLGTSALEAPFKGGTLVPLPTLAVVLTTNAAGELTLGATWPANIPAGTSVWLQAWIVDPAGVYGWAATNALKATQP
jgi:hypothetical protein